MTSRIGREFRKTKPTSCGTRRQPCTIVSSPVVTSKGERRGPRAFRPRDPGTARAVDAVITRR
ncbi:MAG TPA: hypothetical protein DCQ98_08440 [Planctomycetaceae bacterium]|nr:hypothetical protein [Planctomycetaceae bacterium]